MVAALLAQPLEKLQIEVVDDESPDGTGQVADRLAKHHAGRIHVLHRSGKRGLGRAYVDGFTVALANGVDALFHPDGSRVLLAHSCDNPLCQAAEHLSVATPAQNRAEWDRRRSNLGSPLRDIRGARGRAMAVRAALLTGGDVAACLRAGMTAVDRDQLTLF